MKIRLNIIFIILLLFSMFLIFPRSTHADTGSYQISASSDDVNQDGTALTTNSTSLWVGTGQDTTASYLGLRFTNINIPQHATITSAKISLYSSQNQWIQVAYVLAAEKTPDSPTFSSANPPSQRILTGAKVTHNDDTLWQAGAWYSLDEMAPVLQEVIDQSAWQSGNSVSFIFTGTGSAWGHKFVNAWDSSAATAPVLTVTYSTPSPTQTLA
ncbi:MAG TPA: hypothetical protein VFM46_03830, partial [Pseudomonadales bacterium]|nr:hypothetical protein [Pseudomonadales bacterium]